MPETATLVLTAIFALGALAGLIYVLIKLAKEQGGLHAFLGFIFPPYAFIWGWINARRLEMLDIMAFWTFVGIASIAFPLVIGVTSVVRLGDELLQNTPEVFESLDTLDFSDGPVGDEPIFRGSIGPGQQTQGLIDDLFAIDEWTFNGQAGQTVSILCAPVVGSDTDPRIHIYAPSGELVAVDDDGGQDVSALVSNLTLAESGTYRILVDVFSTGPYVLSLN
jgi:hypothetical protein